MNEHDEVKAKMRVLGQAYYQKLPEKLNEILNSWHEAYKQETNASQLENLHRISHSIKGSSSTFGFQEIGEAATALDDFFKELIKNEISIKDKEDVKFKSLFRELVLASKNTTK